MWQSTPPLWQIAKMECKSRRNWKVKTGEKGGGAVGKKKKKDPTTSSWLFLLSLIPLL